jgi:hypothetical protein
MADPRLFMEVTQKINSKDVLINVDHIALIESASSDDTGCYIVISSNENRAIAVTESYAEIKQKLKDCRK